MRRSEAAVAVIRREGGGQALWLARWNPNWGAYHLVAGHREPGESPRECLVREIEEELALREGDDYRVRPVDPKPLEFDDFSLSARVRTHYIMNLFDVDLDPAVLPKVDADPDNRWLSAADVEAGRAADGRPVSATMRRLLAALDAGPCGDV